MSDGRLSQAIVVERSCAAKTTSHDHAVAVSGQTVTDTTENVVAFAATHDDLFGDGEWKGFDSTRIRVCAGRGLSLLSLHLLASLCVRLRVRCAWSTFLSGVELSIRAQEATRDRSLDRLSTGKPIAEKGRSAKGLHLRLVLHVITTTSGENEQE